MTAHFNSECEFNPLEVVEASVRDILASKPCEWYCYGLLTLAEQWQKTKVMGCILHCKETLYVVYISLNVLLTIRKYECFCFSLKYNAKVGHTFDSFFK